jgi:AcrR family transcriptional regulator
MRRADAERNRAKILQVARTAFAQSDADVSMAEISRRAGVGMATLYRNFPDRRELLEALYTDEVDAVCEAAKTSNGEKPGEAYITWLRRFFTFSTSKRLIASELLTHADSTNPVFGESRARVLEAGRPLLIAAQRAHQISSDLTLEQTLDLIVAIAKIGSDAAYLEPILQAALGGLHLPSGSSAATAGPEEVEDEP